MSGAEYGNSLLRYVFAPSPPFRKYARSMARKAWMTGSLEMMFFARM